MTTTDEPLDRMAAQADAAAELVAAIATLAGPVMAMVTESLTEAERRGYFTLAKDGAAVAERVALAAQAPPPANAPSTLALLRQLREPEVRRSLSVLLTILHAAGESASKSGNQLRKV